jgi:hypothetical protein
MYLLAGRANLTEFDAALTFAQNSNNALATLQNLPGAFSELLRLTEEKYSIDFTIIDLNPSLSSINQNLFLSSDAFLVPTNPDPFSMMALDTLQSILPKWVNWKRSAESLFEDSAYPLAPGLPKYAGSVIQRFNIRNGRAAKPYRDNIEELKSKLSGDFLAAMRSNNMAFSDEIYGPELIKEQYCLAEIPDFQGLLPKSFRAGVPVFELTDEEIGESGPVLEGLQKKRKLFNEHFEAMAGKIQDLLSHA